MEFVDWLDDLKSSDPLLKDFIDKLRPFFNDSGFNSIEFERKVSIGLEHCDKIIDDSLNPNPNAQN